MKFIIIAIFVNIFALQAKPIILTADYVTKFLIEEITSSGAEVDVISSVNDGKPGLKSSDIFKINAAKAFVYLSENHKMGFINVPNEKSFRLVDFLPDSQRISVSYGEVFDFYIDSLTYDIDDTLKLDSLVKYYYSDSTANEYFYLDPLLVSNMLPDIEKELSLIIPEMSNIFKQNVIRFRKRLDLLHKQIEKELSKLRGMPVYSESPFLEYFIKRYNLHYAASLNNPFNFEDTYKDFIIKDMEKIGINTMFVSYNFKNEKLENVNIKRIDIFANNKKYDSYTDFILQLTRDIKNSLMFY